MNTLAFKLRMAAVNAKIRLMEAALIELVENPEVTQSQVLRGAAMLAQVCDMRRAVEHKFRSNAK